MNTDVSSRIQVADQAYLDHWRGEIFCLIKEYYRESGDKHSTPVAVLVDMIESIDSPGYLLMVHETDNTPDGFIFCKMVTNVARILMAFLGKGLENREIIKEALILFDAWAKEKKCIAADLYTHRYFRSFKTLTDNGWHHNYTVYRKNY